MQNQENLVGSLGELSAQRLGNRNGLHRETEKRPRHVPAFKDCVDNPIYGLSELEALIKLTSSRLFVHFANFRLANIHVS